MQNYEQTLVIYDFCGTIVDVQTANEYIRYVKKHLSITGGSYELLRLILNKCGFIQRYNYCYRKIAINKGLLLKQIKGIKYEVLDSLARSYYYEKVKPHIIPEVEKTILSHKRNGDLVSVVSAGYDIYLKYFVQDYDIPVLISSKLSYNNMLSTGSVEGYDNFGQEKVNNVYRYFGQSRMQGFKSIIGYSDSETDIPILSICTKRIGVKRGDQNCPWMNAINAEVLSY